MKRSNQTRRSSRSPKQKITEQKTPCYAPDVVDGEFSPEPDDERPQTNSASHAEAVRHALYGVATEDGASSSRLPSRISSINWNFNEDELDGITGDEDGIHSGSFGEHRRKHYDNEHKKAKLLAQEPENKVEGGESIEYTSTSILHLI
uniref:Uncharacterized protein n=1 Tax=Physcomitrium patens TaxID=3218 RepID=A0A2K1J515_PHYPA|nr:hypothetical protein PHYPA_022451 [Physcomitrium patens]